MTILEQIGELFGVEVSAIFIHCPWMPDGYLVGTVYGDDPVLVEQLRDTIDAWGGNWTVNIGEELPEWFFGDFSQQLDDDGSRFVIEGREGYISNEEYAFGPSVPIMVIRDGYFPLQKLDQ